MACMQHRMSGEEDKGHGLLGRPPRTAPRSCSSMLHLFPSRPQVTDANGCTSGDSLAPAPSRLHRVLNWLLRHAMRRLVSPETASMVSDSLALTRLSAGVADNVLPQVGKEGTKQNDIEVIIILRGGGGLSSDGHGQALAADTEVSESVAVKRLGQAGRRRVCL